jgi:hypothetical protein
MGEIGAGTGVAFYPPFQLKSLNALNLQPELNVAPYRPPGKQRG